MNKTIELSNKSRVMLQDTLPRTILARKSMLNFVFILIDAGPYSPYVGIEPHLIEMLQLLFLDNKSAIEILALFTELQHRLLLLDLLVSLFWLNLCDNLKEATQ